MGESGQTPATPDRPRYRHTYDTTFLSVEPKEDMRVLSNWGWMVRVYNIELTDWPDGLRTVRIEGQHIRKDGEPGAHRRGGSWKGPERLPGNLAAVVEDARPGWWMGGESGD